MSRGWQFLDRPGEFDALRSALTREDCGGVVLIGPAGVGKTTLARAVTASLPASVQWVAGTRSARTLPLGAFARQVGDSGSRDPLALLVSARDALLSTADTVLGVDDAYLLDPLSATLVHQIAVDGHAGIIATVRSGEPVPDAVTSLWKDGFLDRFELAPLTRQQSLDLVEGILGGTLEGLSADVIWQSSGGNPLFLRHLVEGALEAGTLRQVGAVWQLSGTAGVSSGLASLLEDRLDRTADDVHYALELLSLCEPLDVDTLAELAGEGAVNAAETQGLIRIVDEGGRLDARFCHPVYGEVVRQRIGTIATRRLRGRLVQALRMRPGDDSPASRIRLAQLSIGSDQHPDGKLLVSAANDAIALSDVPLGEHLARAAYAAGGGLPAAEALSRALLWQGHPAAADAVLAAFDPETLDELEVVLWGVPRVSILFWSTGDDRQAHAVLDILQARVTHPNARLVVDATAAALMVHENRIADAIAAAEAVLADPDAPAQAVECAAFTAGLAMPVAGRGTEFEPIAARCRAHHKATDGMIKAMVRYGDVLALTTTGALDRADLRVAAHATFSSAGQRLGWAIGRVMAGLVALQRGRLPDAISSIEQALAALAAEESLPWLLPARLLLVKAYAAAGNPTEAERIFADAKGHAGPTAALHEPQRLLAQAWLVAANSGPAAGVELAMAAADAAHRCGQYAVEADALHQAARLGDATVAGRLDTLTQRVDGLLVGLQARHAAAVAVADGAELDAVSRVFEDAGFLLYAAEAVGQAGRHHLRAEDRRRAAECFTRAQRLAAACGGARTPAIRAAAPLPGSERDIADLLAAGLSIREIAQRLVVSVRTVEGHVYRTST